MTQKVTTRGLECYGSQLRGAFGVQVWQPLQRRSLPQQRQTPEICSGTEGTAERPS